jgi:hypothetical protein
MRSLCLGRGILGLTGRVWMGMLRGRSGRVLRRKRKVGGGES